jgi:hypothetical protein
MKRRKGKPRASRRTRMALDEGRHYSEQLPGRAWDVKV